MFISMKTKWSVLALVLVAYASPASAGIIYNPGNSFAEFSVTAGHTPGEYGVAANKGPAGTGDNAITFTPRNTNDHILRWNVSTVVAATDTLKLDIRNILALGTANLTVRVYYDGNPTPSSPSFVLATDAYQNITVPMPGGGNHTIDKIDFVIAQNTKVLYLDNLTLTNQIVAVPEPASMGLIGAGAVAMLLRRKR